MYNCICVVVRYILRLCFTILRCVERDSVALFSESLRAVIIRYDIQCNGTVYVDGFCCHPFISPALPPVLDPLFFPLVLHLLSYPSLFLPLFHSSCPLPDRQKQVARGC